ncbi:MAG: PH domain-containing protein [Prevotella sp.]|nr:PH domain-containing protein [Prevotella sp.]
MSYIEKNLMEGEQVVYEARQHWIIYWKPFLLMLLGIALFAIPTQDVELIVQVIAAAVLFVIAAIWAVNIYGGRKYILTTSRLILKRGIVRRESTDLILRRCEGVSIRQSMMGRILSYGTVEVTTGEVVNSFQMIEDPVRFSTQINQQISRNFDPQV